VLQHSIERSRTRKPKDCFPGWLSGRNLPLPAWAASYSSRYNVTPISFQLTLRPSRALAARGIVRTLTDIGETGSRKAASLTASLGSASEDFRCGGIFKRRSEEIPTEVDGATGPNVSVRDCGRFLQPGSRFGRQAVPIALSTFSRIAS
jgi:hypothetical protein